MNYAVTNIGTIKESTGISTFELLEKDAAPGSADLPLTTGVSLSWQRTDHNLWSGLMPGSLTAPVRDVNEVLRDRIFAGGETTFRLRWLKDGQVMWTGYVLADLFRGSWDAYNHTAVFEAIDLGRLEGIDFPAYDDDNRVTHLALFVELLALTGLDLNIHIVCNTYPYTPGTPVSGNPLADVDIDRGRFARVTSTGQRVAVNAWDVLKDRCEHWLMCLCQCQGAWHLIQRTEKVGTYTEYVYDSAGTLLETNTVDPVLFSWNDRKAGRNTIIKGGTIERSTPIIQTANRYDHGEVGGNIIEHPSFEGTFAWETQNKPRKWTRVTELGEEQSDADSIFFRSDKARTGRDAAGIRGRSIALQDVQAGGDPEGLATRYLRYNGPTISANANMTMTAEASVRLDASGTTIPDPEAPRDVWHTYRVGAKWLERGEDGTFSWSDSFKRIKFSGDGGIFFNYQSERIVIDLPAEGGDFEARLYNAVETHALGDGLGGFPPGEDHVIEAHWDDVYISIASTEGAGTTSTEFVAVVQ